MQVTDICNNKYLSTHICQPIFVAFGKIGTLRRGAVVIDSASGTEELGSSFGRVCVRL
jgi:hypothetical protein